MIKPSFKTPDFKAEIAKLKKLSMEKLQEIEDEIKDSADRIMLDAKRQAPINESILRKSISKMQESPFEWTIVADSKHAAFMEFGTRTLVSIPPGAEEIAREAERVYYSGNRGTIKDMERAIRRWVKLKGIAGTYSVKTRRRTGSKATRQREDDSVVFLIMRKILKVGVKPQPFFYPAIQREVPILERKIKNIIGKDGKG